MSIDVHLARYERFSVVGGCWIVTCGADLARFPDFRADSSRCDRLPSPKVEGEAGERERGGVAASGELRHAARPVSPPPAATHPNARATRLARVCPSLSLSGVAATFKTNSHNNIL